MRRLKMSFILLSLFTLVLGVAYPLLMMGIGHLFFPFEARGSLLQNKQGTILGSALIAQDFTQPHYFHPRPSAAHYNAANSTGSNLGPTSQKLMDDLKSRVEVYRKENNLHPNMPIPADAVTSSGSGLDPHISLANARLQAKRVASARNLTEKEVMEKIEAHTEKPFLTLFGTKRVNVLLLNLSLDEKK